MNEQDQAQGQLTADPDDREPRRLKQQQAIGGRGSKCPKCGYELRKYAIQCPKCRTSLLPQPRESDADLARRYLKLLDK